MVRKVYKDLTPCDITNGIIMKSTLSNFQTEQLNDTTHIVLKTDEDREYKTKRLLDDKFFNGFKKYNIIRR